ncbi:helix-turn-helix domain-containing protein [Pseudoclavibacter helvolus]|uniref:helix-turn-helix domain-containing protein n=1 Tax=Pseudoclavibacter helvolus TaxID=255205 RepID=UPI0008385E04|nr:helix-turn-helix domain-containing protein [Pseudoclavibacter helvolus]
MNTSTILQGAAIEQNDVDQLTAAVESLPPESPVRAVVTRMLAALDRGAGITLVEQDKELSPNEVAALLGVSRPHIMKMVRTGALKAHHVGTHLRIAFADYEDFVARRDSASKYVAEVIAAAQNPAVEPFTDEELRELNDL